MRLCNAVGCSRPAHARGYCHAHYLRQRRGSTSSRPVGERAERSVALPGVRVSPQVAEALRMRAKQRGQTLSEYVRSVLHAAFEQPVT